MYEKSAATFLKDKRKIQLTQTSKARKISFTNEGEIKNISDIQKLQEFNINRSACQEMLK